MVKRRKSLRASKTSTSLKIQSPRSSLRNKTSTSKRNSSTTESTTNTSTSNINKRKHFTPKKKKSVTIAFGRRKMKVTKLLLREIKKLQLSTNLLIPKLSFAKVFREIIYSTSQQVNRVQVEALNCLHEAAEHYLVSLFEDSNLMATHANRVTVRPNDMKLVIQLRGLRDPGYSS